VPRTYQAFTTLVIGQSLQEANPTNEDLYISRQLAQTYRELATRQPILRGAADALGLSYTPSRESISAWLEPGTQLLSIGVLDTDPERARALADAIAEQLILQTPNEIAEERARQDFARSQLQNLQESIQTTEEEIRAEQEELDGANSARAIQQHRDNIDALQQKLASYQATYASLMQTMEGRTNYIAVFEPASTPTRPVGPRVIETVLLAAASGLILAVAGALLIEFLDDTLKTPEDAKRALDLPILGSIARTEGGATPSNLVAAHDPLSLVTEAYRNLRTSVRVSSVDEPLRTLVVTSPSASEGKTTTLANLGVVMAQAGDRVVLVDTDLRRSTLHKRFDVPNREGLTNALLEDEPVLDGWLRETEIENLRVLTSGPLPPNPSELLGSLKMRRLIERLKDEADIILFDTPPVLMISDASVLALETDGVLMVADAGRTRRTVARQSLERLRQLGVNVVGVVLNRVRPQRSKSYDYYQYVASQDKKE
jgi:non-specific protein-tyrosine kinase